MRMSNSTISELTKEKTNSKNLVDKLVMDELLTMGFSYSFMGTHYLHDSIVFSTFLKLEDFKCVNSFCHRVNELVRKKYNVDIVSSAVAAAIDRAFREGNINYLLDTFKGSYDKERMMVSNKMFIMTVRKKIMEALEAQQSYNATQLRLIIQGTVENITDVTLLQALCNIVVSMEGGVTL